MSQGERVAWLKEEMEAGKTQYSYPEIIGMIRKYINRFQKELASIQAEDKARSRYGGRALHEQRIPEPHQLLFHLMRRGGGGGGVCVWGGAGGSNLWCICSQLYIFFRFPPLLLTPSFSSSRCRLPAPVARRRLHNVCRRTNPSREAAITLQYRNEEAEFVAGWRCPDLRIPKVVLQMQCWNYEINLITAIKHFTFKQKR